MPRAQAGDRVISGSKHGTVALTGNPPLRVIWDGSRTTVLYVPSGNCRIVHVPFADLPEPDPDGLADDPAGQ